MTNIDTASSQSGAMLEIKNLRTAITSRKGDLFPVDGVDIVIPKGKIVALVGESGCGKSMTANTVMGLLPKNGRAAGGEILYKGQDMLKMTSEQRRKLYGQKISLIFQEPMSSLNPVMKVGRQVEEVLLLHEKIDRKDAKQRVIDMFRSVGIPEPEKRFGQYPHQLSGGLRQRVMISAAMICQPDVLIADEPTTALDVTIEAQILRLMSKLQKEHGTSILLITHDLGVVAELCDIVYVMYAGKIVEHADVRDLFHHPSHPYTVGLMNSLPSVGNERHLQSIPGTVPVLTAMPQGCRFAPRCAFATDSCKKELPELLSVGTNHECRCLHCLKGEAK